MIVICTNCGTKLKVEARLAGKRGKCPKCHSGIDIPVPEEQTGKPPAKAATEKQKEFAKSLGINFPPDITRRQMSDLIDEALERRDEERFRRLDELSERESEAYAEVREEIFAQLDEEDRRLSKATPEEIIEEFERRDKGAILVTFDFDERDIEDLTGHEINTCFTGDLTKENVGTILGQLGIAFLMRYS